MVSYWKWKLLSHVQLFPTPWTVVHGILQARILEWVPFPSPGDLPNPGLEPRSPALQADTLPPEPGTWSSDFLFFHSSSPMVSSLVTGQSRQEHLLSWFMSSFLWPQPQFLLFSTPETWEWTLDFVVRELDCAEISACVQCPPTSWWGSGRGGEEEQGPGNWPSRASVVCWAPGLGVYSAQVPAVSSFEGSSMPPVPAMRPVRF